MKICGLQKTTLLDFPGHVAATIFLGGCNFRCPFCHNSGLLGNDAEEAMTEASLFTFLKRRTSVLEGVCITGGEPTLSDDLEDFIRRIRQMGYLIKLDTNGCYPDALEALLDQGLADYVAMDVKNAPEHYAQTVGIPDFDPAVIARSAAVLAHSGVDYELRTTVVRELHTVADIAAIGAWMQGAPRYFLQCFVDSGALISPGFHAPDRADLEKMLQAARPFFGETALRGVD